MSTAEFKAIVEDFEFIDDWEDRYRYIIEKGKSMPSLDDALKVDATKVHGCASQVWMHSTIDDEIFYFDGFPRNNLPVRSIGTFEAFEIPANAKVSFPTSSPRATHWTAPTAESKALNPLIGKHCECFNLYKSVGVGIEIHFVK